jgi:CheY-like chemotaxis protein
MSRIHVAEAAGLCIIRRIDRNLPILIAEDDEDYQAILENTLRHVGINNPLRKFHDGQEVIHYLSGPRKSDPPPSFMFLDLKMPRAGGLDVLRWMRDHPERAVVPTIVLSSASIDSEVREAYELGAQGFFVKPGRLEELETMLRHAYGFWKVAAKPEVVS